MTNHQFAALLLAQPEKELFILATDPTDWTYQIPVSEDILDLEDIYIERENDEVDDNETNCSVIRIDC